MLRVMEQITNTKRVTGEAEQKAAASGSGGDLACGGSADNQQQDQAIAGKIRPKGKSDAVVGGLELSKAIGEQVSAIMTLTKDGVMKHCRTKFLEPASGEFWVSGAELDEELIDYHLGHRIPVGISFKLKGNKFIFAAEVREGIAELNQAGSEKPIRALKLLWPLAIKYVQRRASHRILLAENTELKGTVLRGGGRGRQEHAPIGLMDISPGGVGLAYECGGNPPLSVGERVEVQLWRGAGGGAGNEVSKKPDTYRFYGEVRGIHPKSTETKQVAGVNLNVPANAEGAAAISWLLNTLEILQQESARAEVIKQQQEGATPSEATVVLPPGAKATEDVTSTTSSSSRNAA